MRTSLLILAFLVLCTPSGAATPTLVDFSNDSLMNTTTITSWAKRITNPTNAGNLLVAACTWHGTGATTKTISVTDDKSNTWTSLTTGTDAGNNQGLGIAYAPNVASGTQVITAVLSGAEQFQCAFFQFFNVATSSPTDGSACSATASGTTIPTGSFTTGTAGDLIFYAGVVDNISTPSSPLSITPGSGFTGMVEDGTSFLGAEYEVQSSAGAINPSMTVGTSHSGAIGCAVAFKSASAGSGLSGMVVNSQFVMTIPMQTSWATTSITIQAPTSGNLFVLSNTVLTNAEVSAVSDSQSNTWAKVTGTGLTNGCARNGSSAKSTCIWYAANATASNSLTVTITFTTTPSSGHTQFGFWDISGAATSPFDTSQGSNGSLAAQTGTVTGPSITPASSSGVIVSAIQEDGQTTGSVSPGYLLTVQPGAYQGGSLDKDGGFMHYYNPNTSAVAVAWTYINTEGAFNVANWQTAVAAFKPAAGAAPTPIIDKRSKLTRIDEGT